MHRKKRRKHRKHLGPKFQQISNERKGRKGRKMEKRRDKRRIGGEGRKEGGKEGRREGGKEGRREAGGVRIKQYQNINKPCNLTHFNFDLILRSATPFPLSAVSKPLDRFSARPTSVIKSLKNMRRFWHA